jgi:hypothetical protein
MLNREKYKKGFGLTLNIYSFIENEIFIKSQMDLQNRT